MKCGFLKDRLMEENIQKGLSVRSDSGSNYEISVKLDEIIKKKLIDYDD